MKARTTALAMLFSLPALGAGYGGASGQNSLGQEVHIADELAESLFIYWVDKPKGTRSREWQGKLLGKFKISEECPGWDWAQDQKEIRCLPSGKSPMAGATYSIEKSTTIKDVCGNGATVYLCVQGCSKPIVPKLIVEQPWEC